MEQFGEKNLTEKISDAIVQYILKQQLKIGDRLPNEYELARELQTGRGTVREAMKLLVSRNIVEVRQGSGTYVSAQKGLSKDPLGLLFVENKIQLAKDLIDLRIIIEPPIAALAAQKATEQNIEVINALCEDVEGLYQQGEDHHMQKDIEFHTAIAQSTQNLVVPRLIPIISFSIELLVERYPSEELFHKTIETHKRVARSIANGDASGAQDAMYLHLVYNRESLRDF